MDGRSPDQEPTSKANLRNRFKPEVTLIGNRQFQDDRTGDIYVEVPVEEIAKKFDSNHLVYPKHLGGVRVLRKISETNDTDQ